MVGCGGLAANVTPMRSFRQYRELVSDKRDSGLANAALIFYSLSLANLECETNDCASGLY
jgi:hypothetical protein